MFVSTKAFLAVLSCALVAYAQGNGTSTSSAPPSTSSVPAGIDQCILTCVTSAATSAGCTSFSDLTCVCTSTAFQETALSCLQQNCTAEDVATAEALEQSQCAGVSSSGALSSTASGSSSASVPGSSVTPSISASSTKTSASGTPTTSSSSAAMALSVPLSFGSLVGTLAASAGALVGAALVF